MILLSEAIKDGKQQEMKFQGHDFFMKGYLFYLIYKTICFLALNVNLL